MPASYESVYSLSTTTYKQDASTSTFKLEMNNLLASSEVYYTGGRLNLANTFDLLHTALPQIRQFRGSGDRNLMVSGTAIAQGIPNYRDGPVYQIDHYYEFDSNGRVKREIQLDSQFPGSGWVFGVNLGSIGVFDYEYECP